MNMSSYVFDKNKNLILKKEIFSGEILSRLEAIARLNKILSDFSKIKIIHLLSMGEINVTEIVGKLNLSQSLISHHLATLRQAGLVKSKKNKKMVFYKLTDYGKEIVSKFLNLPWD